MVTLEPSVRFTRQIVMGVIVAGHNQGDLESLSLISL